MRMPALLLATIALSACGSKEDPAPKSSAFGEVLPGSASDAMLPYDTVTSTPPLEAPQAAIPADSSDDNAIIPEAIEEPADDGAPEPEAS